MARPFSMIDQVKRQYAAHDNQWWLRLALAVGVLLISAFLATRAATMQDPLELLTSPLLLVFPALGGVLLILRFPSLGFLILVAGSLLVPFSLGTGTQTGINFAALMTVGLIGLWVFDMIAKDRLVSIISSATILPLLIFIIIAVLAFLVGQLPWFVFASPASLTAQIGGLAIFILSAGAFLVVAHRVQDLELLKWMTWLYLAIGGAYVIGQIIPPLNDISNLVLQRGTYNNSMFWVWIVAMAFSQGIYNQKLTKFWRAALLALVAGAFFVGLVKNQGWTSGWLPPAAAFATILIVSRSRWSWMAFVIGAVALLLKADSIERILYAGDNTYSLMTRVEAWRIVAEIVQVNPLLGLGPSNYYWYTPLYSILGYSVNFNSHNNYVDLIAQVGLLGLAAFLWFAGATAWVGMRLRERVPQGFAQAYVYGALGGLAGTLVAGMLGDWFLPFVYNVGLAGFRSSIFAWLFLGGLIAIEWMVKNKWQAETSAVER